MDFEYDVFLSHSSKDDAFAKDLARMLGDAGLSVWIDNFKGRPGKRTTSMIQKAMQESRHAVFIVTPNWSQSRWTTGEYEYFAGLCDQEGPRRILLPIFRGIDQSLEFGGTTHLKWPPEADPDEMLWLLWCGLEDQDPDDESEWADKGRRLREAPARGPVLKAQTSPEAQAVGEIWQRCGGKRDALSCDRKKQWADLDTAIGDSRNEVLFVLGSERRAHGRFLERIERCLEHRDSLIKRVEWPNRRVRGALTDGKLKSWLAQSIGSTASNLEADLASELARHHLLLLHSPVYQEDLKSDTFVSYYTELWPALIDGVQKRLANRRGEFTGEVKIIQALSWREKHPSMQLLASLLRRARLRRTAAWIECALERRAVDETLTSISSGAEARGLYAYPLDELYPIEQEDVEELAKRLLREDPQEVRKQFVDQVMSGTRNSDDLIFIRLMDWLG